jgi:hypothetical protein
MRHKRPTLGLMALAVALTTAGFVPAVAGALPSQGGGGPAAPPASGPPKTTPPTTAAPPTTSPPKVTIPTLPGTTAVFEPMPTPTSPGLHPLQASEYAVVVSWYDRSTDENSFAVYRREDNGTWQKVSDVPTRDLAGVGGNYTWTDTSDNQSGQCYMVAAEGSFDAGYSTEECTVRPDPRQFPQSVPSDPKQWYGLSWKNDGTGPLQTGYRGSDTYLTWSHQTFGVDLDWSESTSLWKVEAQRGPVAMYGEAVALRVWGGGWLKYGHQDWGVDLQLSDTPSYEWYILGETPGWDIDGGEFALWNSAAHDYLILNDQTWGVDLNWYQKTLPQNSTPPPPPQGWSSVVAYNCIQEARPLEVWVDDYTAGTGYVDKGELQPLWSDEGGCVPSASTVTTFPLTSGHTYLFRAIDFDAPGCSNDPNVGSCSRNDLTITGGAGGPAYLDEIG